MNNDNNFYEEQDSLRDVIDTQNNAFNPGHYIATGRVPTTVSAPGNGLPFAIFHFLLAALTFLFSWIFFFSALFIILILISVFSLFLALGYLRKAKRYYKAKSVLESEELDEEVEDKLEQRLCPKCDKYHDIDYPKCPYCRYDYCNRRF